MTTTPKGKRTSAIYHYKSGNGIRSWIRHKDQHFKLQRCQKDKYGIACLLKHQELRKIRDTKEVLCEPVFLRSQKRKLGKITLLDHFPS
jgi:hypothetical protein